MWGSFSRSWRDSVVLPAPDGEDSTSIRPRRWMAGVVDVTRHSGPAPAGARSRLSESMPMRVSSMSADFEQSVLASRLNSWHRKSNLRPTGLSGRASASRLLACAICAASRSSSSRTSALPTSSATSWAKRSSDSDGARCSSSASWLSKRRAHRADLRRRPARRRRRHRPSISAMWRFDHARQAPAPPPRGLPTSAFEDLVERRRRAPCRGRRAPPRSPRPRLPPRSRRARAAGRRRSAPAAPVLLRTSSTSRPSSRQQRRG